MALIIKVALLMLFLSLSSAQEEGFSERLHRMLDNVFHKVFPFLTSPGNSTSNGVKQTMEEQRVVPDVIDSAPQDIIEVKYPGDVSVKLGNMLNITEASHRPGVKWPTQPNALYTLSMVDPDAPEGNSEWQHWLVVNIPGDNVSKGETLTEYAGPYPPSGIHRYVVLVYKQGASMNTSNEPKITDEEDMKRAKFSIKKFSKNQGLGQPIAGNFFKVKAE